MESLKILIFNWRCWLNPNAGGAEVFTREVSERWVKDGNEVTLVTSEFPGCKNEEIVNGVRILRIGGRYSVYWKAPNLYRKLLNKEKYDVIIDEINTRPFFTTEFCRNGEKIFALIHQLAREYWFYETPFPINYIGHKMENGWLKNYVNIPTITVSESTKNDLIELSFNNVNVVSPGLNFKPLTEVPLKAAYPVIVYAGRLNRAKRPDYAIMSYKIVKQSLPDAELWIIGNGYFKEELRKISIKGVIFFDDISNDQRRELISRAWVLVNPSIREGFGLNIIEANAMGVPSIVYNVHGLRDSVIDNYTGLIIQKNNIESLAEGITTLFKNDDLRERLTKNSLRHAKNYDWENTAKAFLKVIYDNI
jgi:glycosyltransferase involved in cell wall biosynthesis